MTGPADAGGDDRTGSQEPLFDRMTTLYERYAQITDDIYRPWLRAAVPTCPSGRAVDLGCGAGRFDDLLAERYADVLAVDFAVHQIELAEAKRPHDNVSYEARSILDVTPAADGLFDLVFSVNSIFHLRDHDRVLPHVRSLVRPGGWAVIIDVVNPPGRTRSWHRRQALRVAALTLWRHRSAAEAADVLRLRLGRTWLHHVTLNTPLPRPEFHRRYAAAFPGAVFDDGIDRYLCGMRWQAPL